MIPIACVEYVSSSLYSPSPINSCCRRPNINKSTSFFLSSSLNIFSKPYPGVDLIRRINLLEKPIISSWRPWFAKTNDSPIDPNIAPWTFPNLSDSSKSAVHLITISERCLNEISQFCSERPCSDITHSLPRESTSLESAVPHCSKSIRRS